MNSCKGILGLLALQFANTVSAVDTCNRCGYQYPMPLNQETARRNYMLRTIYIY
jgi:hypothetical protein